MSVFEKTMLRLSLMATDRLSCLRNHISAHYLWLRIPIKDGFYIQPILCEYQSVELSVGQEE